VSQKPTEAPATDPVAATDTTPTDTAPAPIQDEQDDDPLAAMDTGIEAATAGKADEPADPFAEDDDAPAADPAADPAAVPAEPADPAAKSDEPPAPDEIDAEATSLGLKGKANERFRGMAEEIKSFAPIREALEQAGVKSADDVPKLLERATFAEEMAETIQKTGASAEQYGQALDYLEVVNHAVKSADPAAAKRALDILRPELEILAKLSGEEIPGFADPLEGHDDLRAEVEAGDMSRKLALELAAARARDQLTGQRRQAQQQQTEQQAASQQGVEALNGFEAQMTASDPLYAAKRPQLVQMVGWIKANLPPSNWLAATQQAYASIPAPAAAPAPAAKPPVGNVPMRPTGARNLAPVAFDDPMAAMDAGIKAAQG
jgi:hypothetical protein